MCGLGAHVLTLASDCCLIDAGLKLRTLRLPDIFQDQDKPEKQYADAGLDADGIVETRSEEHTSELQSLMRISYAVFCLKKKKTTMNHKKQATNTIVSTNKCDQTARTQLQPRRHKQ